jgi:Glycosyl transferase 4-like domain
MADLQGDAPVNIVAYHFLPSPEVGAKRMTALAKSLRDIGERVLVFSAFEGIEALDPEDVRWQLLHDLEIERIPDPPSAFISFVVRAKQALKNSWRAIRDPTPTGQVGYQAIPAVTARTPRLTARKLFFDVVHVVDDKKRWSLRMAGSIFRASRRSLPGVIIVSGPPMSSLIGATFVARLLRVPLIVDLRDPIVAENELIAAGEGLPIQWGRRALERFALRAAGAVVTTSPTLRSRLSGRYPKLEGRIRCIYNGFDEAPVTPSYETGNRLVIVYAGALYLNRNPFPFLQALDDFLQQPNVAADRIEVIFVGDCARYRGVSLIDWLGDHRCGRIVTIRQQITHDELRELYRNATLLLNFAEGQRMQVPAKTFELLAQGRELMMFCEPTSDTAAIVKGISGVFCVTSDEHERLIALLGEIYHRHVSEGRLRAPLPSEIERFSRAAQNTTFKELVMRTRRARQGCRDRGSQTGT